MTAGDSNIARSNFVIRRRDGDDPVGLVCHFEVAEREALARREGRHHMDRGFAAFLVGGTAQRLAVEGDHIHRYAYQLATQATKRRWNSVASRVAKMSPRWSCDGVPSWNGRKPAPQRDLLLVESRDIDKRIRSGEHTASRHASSVLLSG